jgi:hypothetical protein
MGKGTKHIEWNGARQPEAIDLLLGKGHMIVGPTKVGYIIMTWQFLFLCAWEGDGVSCARSAAYPRCSSRTWPTLAGRTFENG